MRSTVQRDLSNYWLDLYSPLALAGRALSTDRQICQYKIFYPPLTKGKLLLHVLFEFFASFLIHSSARALSIFNYEDSTELPDTSLIINFFSLFKCCSMIKKLKCLWLAECIIKRMIKNYLSSLTAACMSKARMSNDWQTNHQNDDDRKFRNWCHR